jgi:hypothetical protein
VVGWSIRLPRAGRPSGEPALFTIEDQKEFKHEYDDSFLAPSRVKLATIAMAGMLGALLSVSDAQAFTCVRGLYRAGCVSAYGAVGVSRNGAVAVGRYGNVYAYHRGSSCVWRNGQRICF